MSFRTVLQALRAPEDFAVRHAATPADPPVCFGLSRSDLGRFGALSGCAALGVGAFGGALHAHGGALSMAHGAMGAVGAAGGAWVATLPALYVLGTLAGSPLRGRALLLGSLVTVSFGGLAMLASVPVLWFFELALPFGMTRLVVALLSFLGVGLCMSDVFIRVMAALGCRSLLNLAWLALLAATGGELFFVAGLFDLL